MQCDLSSTEARAFLAEAVAGLHERVDRAMTLDRMASAEDYRHHLHCHARVIFPLESVLRSSPHAGCVPDAAMRWRSEALAGDLAVLGAVAPDGVPMQIGATRAAFAGALYVLEGSRLGAKVLLGRLGPLAGRELPVAFLSHGAGSKFWPSFVKWLNSIEWTCGERDEMRESAQEVFRAYLAASEDGA